MRKLLYIDLFCGAGGTSTGVESATLDGQKCAHVIACVNHDPHAIASHLANHPEALHFTIRFPADGSIELQREEVASPDA